MAVTVSGGGTTTLTFSVTSSSGTNFANDFPGSYPAVNTLSTGGTASTVAGALNVVDSGTSPAVYTIPGADQYSFISTGQATTIDGSAGGDTLAGGADMTYIEAAGAGDNRIIFTNGTNLFQGSSTGGTGDTIVGGSGYDTIITGGGPSTVFSGSGHTYAYLDDSVGGDVAVLANGTTTVVGSSVAGVNDTVAATADGLIYGGAGTLTFSAGVSSTPFSDTIVGDTAGTVTAFGNANLDLVFEGGGKEVFQAGAGNETLDGSLSGGFSFFGDTNAGDSVGTTVHGGNSDYFLTGAGTEFFTAGSSDIFEIASVTSATISIADFSGSDSVKFDSPTVSGTTDGNNFTYTLSDGTKVEFIGLTTPPAHII